MKLSANKVDPYVRSFSAKVGAGKVILLYGRDQGAIRETASQLGSCFLGKDADPLQKIEFNETELSGSPAKAVDEASSMPMFGGDKLVMIRGQNEAVRKAVDLVLREAPMANALVIIEAGNLAPSSGLRKLVEAHDCAMALPFYEPDAQELSSLIRQLCEAEGYSIEASALAELSGTLGADRGIVRREIERLVLFKGPRDKKASRETGRITAEDISACMHDQSHISLDMLVDAVSLGEMEVLDKSWGRLISMGTRPEGALTVIRRHFQTLHLVVSQIENGTPRQDALRAFRPPLHFKRRPKVERQCNLWSSRKIEAALEILHETERACRQTGARTETQTAYNLMRLARAAGR